MTKAEMGLIRDTIKDLQAAVKGRVPLEKVIDQVDDNITFIHRRVRQRQAVDFMGANMLLPQVP